MHAWASALAYHPHVHMIENAGTLLPTRAGVRYAAVRALMFTRCAASTWPVSWNFFGHHTRLAERKAFAADAARTKDGAVVQAVCNPTATESCQSVLNNTSEQELALSQPEQKPYPPILLGGESDYTLRRVVEFGNGWLPRQAARVRSRSRRCPPAPSCSRSRARSDDLFNHGVQRTGRRGGTRVLPESRYSPGAARSAGSRPRRGAARARSECAARARSGMNVGRIHSASIAAV